MKLSKLSNLLKFFYNAKQPCFLSIDEETYTTWKLLIKISVILNKNYKSCEIYRKKYKSMKNIVVIGLRHNGKVIKRRTNGFAKSYLENHRHAKCPYCGVKLTNENATADHIVPISQGSNNSQINLVVCCQKCNGDKGDMSLKKFLKLKKLNYKKIF